MAIAVTSEAGPSCKAEAAPVAVLELFDSPDTARRPSAMQHELETTVHAVEGVVYVVAGDDEWVLTPGDNAAIHRGVAYRRWNAGDDQAHWVEVYCAV